MIEGLKPYPRTKDSGIAWLGEIPNTEMPRLKSVVRNIVKLPHPASSTGPYIALEHPSGVGSPIRSSGSLMSMQG